MNGAIGNILISRSVVLVGLMGSGKSTVGRRLAKRLDMDFVDADEVIEEAAGLSINDIFEVHGEKAFRDGERRVILRLLSNIPHVMATGGGAFMDLETRKNIKSKAISVWLRADRDILFSRIKHRTNRPLLRVENKKEVLGALVKERYPIYAEADIIIDSHDCPQNETVQKVVEALTAFLEHEENYSKI